MENEHGHEDEEEREFSPEELWDVDRWQELRNMVPTLIEEYQEVCGKILEDAGITTHLDADEDWVGDTEGLPTAVATECLFDTSRTEKLGLAIVDAAVELGGAYGIKSPLIADMGTGTGILAFMADRIFREAGMIPRIVAVEIEPETAEVARKTLATAGAEYITVVDGDAREISNIPELDGAVHLILSENLSAGLVEEHQAQIVLAAHAHNQEHGLERNQSFFVPRGIDLMVALADVEPPVERHISRHALEKLGRTAVEMSEVVKVLSIDFREIYESGVFSIENGVASAKVDFTELLNITRAGVVNSLMLRMVTRCSYDKDTFIEPNQHHSLGNDKFIPLMQFENRLTVDEGDRAELAVAYTAGDHSDDIYRNVTVK